MSLALTNRMYVAGSRGSAIHLFVINIGWTDFTSLTIMCATEVGLSRLMFFLDILAYSPYAQLWESLVVCVTLP